MSQLLGFRPAGTLDSRTAKRLLAGATRALRQVLTVRGLRRALKGLAALAAALTAIVYLVLTIAPKTGLYATFTVLSQSMEPAIPRGSVVIVSPVDPKTLRPGDVITYSSSEPPYPTLTHRIVSIDESEDGRVFHTKGDANILDDPWTMSYAGSAGKVRTFVPLAGYVIAATSTALARTGLGLLMAALLAFLWITVMWLRPRMVEAKRQLALAAPSMRSRVGSPVAPVRMAILGWLAVSLMTAVLATYRRRSD